MNDKLSKKETIKAVLITIVIILFCYAFYKKGSEINQNHRQFYSMLSTIDTAQKNYDKEYIKIYPEMKIVINKFNDCKKGLATAVEGCLEYATTDKKEQLNDYLDMRINVVNEVLIKYKNTDNEYIKNYMSFLPSYQIYLLEKAKSNYYINNCITTIERKEDDCYSYVENKKRNKLL